MILLLSDFLRHSVRKREQDFELLEQEIEFLNLYLEIEKVRFGHRLQIDLNCDSELYQKQIPSQLLQPLVENAIKYGLYGNLGDLVISIQITAKENGLQIAISNPFEENAVNASKGTGYGIKSIEQKLKILFGRTDLIRIDKMEKEFLIEIFIP
jgi:two-component system LytT family sensor kinase